MSAPHFLLGVGAQKSGTTWLHDYLCGHPAANFGFLKEYHIFDALWIKEPDIVERYLQRRINRVAGPNARRQPVDLALARFLRNPEEYFSFFARLLAKYPEVRLTGDITPSYSGLSAEHLSFIRRRVEARGMSPKVVFLMRDPVQRCISAMRMDLRNANLKKPWDADLENRALAERYRTRRFQIRGRYDQTITHLEQAFEGSQIHYEFYEELFTQEAIARLCKFLELDFIAPDFSRQLNVSKTSNAVSPELQAAVREFYDPVYRFVSDRFGARRIASLWAQS